ncbi:fad binding domain-containing [Trichoderma arundinaceum]|uniref:Fad binding domain-containing n=1 Tax=Trichoderma arundinaceum TaxID=490622 RepID=A0A395P0J1_TRIAR|nr:fad binding domain-containing [Trichoderma arundinaceum]
MVNLVAMRVASLLLVALGGAGGGVLAAPAAQDVVPSTTTAASSVPSGSICCAALTAALKPKVASACSANYNHSLSSYWAAQEESISPSCILLATSAQDVSQALKVLVPLSCKFAVRSGGHGAIPGIANIQGGVTIDLTGLNGLALSKDKSTVDLGPGQTWGSVYTQLQASGVTVSGGRDGPVGVGGSVLGGGFGYWAPKTGFTCDITTAYEVVLANGTIVTATATKNTNLYKALKGGSSNFGIVTKFTIKTFPIGQIWGGDSYYYTSSLNDHVQALYDFTANPNYDTDAGYFLCYAYTPGSGPLLTNRIAYAKPVVNPPAFQAITSIPGQVQNTTQIIDLGTFSNQSYQSSPVGYQQDTWAVTFTNNVQWLQNLWTIYENSIPTLSGVANVTWSLTLEPMTPSIAVQTKANGGNVLGLDSIPSEGLILCLLSATWVSPNDTKKMNAASDQLLQNIIQGAKKQGVYNAYVDMNHAGRIQDPITSYGATNAAFLRQTAKQVDPKGVFQKLMPGGFKV